MGYNESALGEKIDYCVGAELAFARKNFKGNRYNLTALTEEVGELNRAMLNHACGKSSAQDIFNEAIQVIVMAKRVIDEGDADFPYKYDDEFYRNFNVNKT